MVDKWLEKHMDLKPEGFKKKTEKKAALTLVVINYPTAYIKEHKAYTFASNSPKYLGIIHELLGILPCHMKYLHLSKLIFVNFGTKVLYIFFPKNPLRIWEIRKKFTNIPEKFFKYS